MAQEEKSLMIEAMGLTKYFDSFKAIEDISFHIDKGEIVGLIGPNGSGKTTTMRILTCFMPPTEGTAKIGGYDVITDSLEVRRRIGYFPEGAPLYTSLPVETYLKFVADIKGVEAREIDKKIGRTMELCGINHVSKRYIENLSKGYRQRVCLAQAILNDPDVLILDEPTVGLDPGQVVEVRNLIKELSGERTVLLSTHILSEVSMICGRVLIISKGRLIAEDTIEDLYKKARARRRLSLKVKGPIDGIKGLLEELGVRIEGVEREDGDVWAFLLDAGRDIRSELSRAIISKGWELLDIGFKEATLEDIYLELIGNAS